MPNTLRHLNRFASRNRLPCFQPKGHSFRKQILEETVQEPIAGVIGLPRLGEHCEAISETFLCLGSCDPGRLIQQRDPTLIAAKFVVGVQESFPPGIGRRDWIHCHGIAIVGIGQQRTLVLRDAISHAQHVGAISLLLVLESVVNLAVFVQKWPKIQHFS